MKVRKIVAGLAAVSMMAAFSAQAVLAAETVTISADKVAAEVGATFTMNVELSGVPAAGLSVCEFAVTYDNALVEITGVKVGAVADKKAAIEIAKGLATLGSDVSVEITGFDITVTEANIILSNEESAILLAESKILNYISAVDALADMTDLAEIRRGIANATALKANADASIAGVPEATAKLEAAIASFNARMNAANSELKEVSNVALSALGTTVPTQRFGEIVAIIKKFYE